jgi:hypothetical protein
MIRLTVLYNLPPGTDEAEFLVWRLGEHQESNASMPGVVRTDFARIDKGFPDDQPPRYRFMTTADWVDRESFEKSFYDPEMQATLKEDVKRITDSVFLISEILAETVNSG